MMASHERQYVPYDPHFDIRQAVLYPGLGYDCQDESFGMFRVPRLAFEAPFVILLILGYSITNPR